MTLHCPLCDSPETRVIYRVSASDAAQNWILKQNEPARHEALAAHIRTLWHQDEGAAMECARCSFGFAHPFVAGDATFYEMAFGKSNYPRQKWEFLRTVEALEANKVAGEALEVGAGYGYFLDQASPRFFKPQDVTAIEYNPTAIEKLKASGYAVTSIDVSELVAAGRKFSAIFLFQVLEHRDRPHDTFAAFQELLVDGGHLFIAVPNPPSVRFWEANQAFLDVPPNHIGFWTQDNLRYIGDRYGLDLTETALEPFSMRDFMKWDVLFGYMWSAQRGQFPASYLYSKRQSAAGRIANAAALVAHAPRRIPVWLKAWKNRETLPLHIWAHFVKRPDGKPNS